MRPRLATSKESGGCSTGQYSPVYLVNRVSKPYKDPPAPAYFSLSSERCDVVMQPHHRREGLFGRHRRPGPGALRRGPGGGVQAVRGPQACLGDATGRLRALNGHSCHPFFGPRNGPRCPHHPWVERGLNVRPAPQYHRLHCHGLPHPLVLLLRRREICPYVFGFGLHVVPRVCWGRPQCTVRSYSVQHALALSSFPFVDTVLDVLRDFLFCMRAMCTNLKVRLCHFELFLRDRF